MCCRARFQAAWWDHPRLGDGIGHRPSDNEFDQWLTWLAKQYEEFADALGERLSPRRRALYEKLFAEALQKSNIFGTVTVVDSDMPADEPVDGFQYKVWLDDKLDGKSVMAWILANAKGEKRPVQVTVGYGQNFGGLPDMVARMKTAIDQFPAE